MIYARRRIASGFATLFSAASGVLAMTTYAGNIKYKSKQQTISIVI